MDAFAQLPREVLVAIARAVERAGGDMLDVEDLAEVWARLFADRHGRLDVLRRESREAQARALEVPAEVERPGRWG